MASLKIEKTDAGYEVTATVVTETEEKFAYTTLDEAVAKLKELETPVAA